MQGRQYMSFSSNALVNPGYLRCRDVRTSMVGSVAADMPDSLRISLTALELHQDGAGAVAHGNNGGRVQSVGPTVVHCDLLHG